MGTVQRGNGQLNDSVENRRASRELYEALLASDPDNAQLKDQLAYAWRGEGLALSLVGRGEHAVAAYNNALAGFDELVIIDPGNSRWARDRMETISESLIAQLAADMPKLDGAQELVEALQDLDKLSDAGNGDVSPQRLGREALASALASLVHVPELSEMAARQVEQSFTTLQGLQANNAADLDINLWLLEVALLSAQVGQGLHDGELRSIVDSFSELAGSIEDPIYLSAQARAWFMLSDVEKAEPLVRKLMEAGYRSRRFDRECRHAGVCRT
jgi:tetratricopeptide (TPR) repeat protein